MAGDLQVLSRRGRVMRWFLAGYGVLIYLFLFGPIALLVLFSFNANRYGTFPITAWTLKWYRTAIGNYQIHDAVSTTLRRWLTPRSWAQRPCGSGRATTPRSSATETGGCKSSWRQSD